MSRKYKNMPGYEYDHRKNRWVKSSLGALGLEVPKESDYSKEIATNFLSNMHLSQSSIRKRSGLVVSSHTPGVEVEGDSVHIVDREAYLKHMMGLEESFDVPQEVIDYADEWGDDVNGDAFVKTGDDTFMMSNSSLHKIAAFTIESVYGMDKIEFQGEVQKLGDKFVEESKEDLNAQYKEMLRLKNMGFGNAIKSANIKDVSTGESYPGYVVSNPYDFNHHVSKVCTVDASPNQIAFYYKNGEIVPNIQHLKSAVVKRAEKFSQ